MSSFLILSRIGKCMLNSVTPSTLPASPNTTLPVICMKTAGLDHEKGALCPGGRSSGSGPASVFFKVSPNRVETNFVRTLRLETTQFRPDPDLSLASVAARRAARHPPPPTSSTAPFPPWNPGGLHSPRNPYPPTPSPT